MCQDWKLNENAICQVLTDYKYVSESNCQFFAHIGLMANKETLPLNN